MDMQSFSILPVIAQATKVSPDAPIFTIGFWLLIGIVAGALARFLLPGDQKMNWFLTMMLGIGGALIGGYVSRYLPLADQPWMPLVSATLGAFLLLVVFQVLGVFKPKS